MVVNCSLIILFGWGSAAIIASMVARSANASYTSVSSTPSFISLSACFFSGLSQIDIEDE